MNRKVIRTLAAALITAGIAQLGFVAGVLIDSDRLERASRVAGLTPSPWRLERADVTRQRALPGAPIGHLEIPRLRLQAAIVEGVDAHSLLSGVGHVPNTAFPGEPDNTSLAGHRDTHFAPLRRVVPGDRIRIDTADGVFVYAVDSSMVVAPDRVDLMRPTGRAMLTLITCYPFRWIGPAPRRFVVRAHAVAASASVGREVTDRMAVIAKAR